MSRVCWREQYLDLPEFVLWNQQHTLPMNISWADEGGVCQLCRHVCPSSGGR